jgi:hypothetical protein
MRGQIEEPNTTSKSPLEEGLLVLKGFSPPEFWDSEKRKYVLRNRQYNTISHPGFKIPTGPLNIIKWL